MKRLSQAKANSKLPNIRRIHAAISAARAAGHLLGTRTGRDSAKGRTRHGRCLGGRKWRDALGMPMSAHARHRPAQSFRHYRIGCAPPAESLLALSTGELKAQVPPKSGGDWHRTFPVGCQPPHRHQLCHPAPALWRFDPKPVHIPLGGDSRVDLDLPRTWCVLHGLCLVELSASVARVAAVS